VNDALDKMFRDQAVARAGVIEAARARFIVEHSEGAPCPNCSAPIIGHADDGCILQVFADVARNRGEHSEGTILELHRRCSADDLWNAIRPIVDSFERGEFNYGNE
jgi:hypothetical protein